MILGAELPLAMNALCEGKVRGKKQYAHTNIIKSIDGSNNFTLKRQTSEV